jgi:hypothetical protein
VAENTSNIRIDYDTSSCFDSFGINCERETANAFQKAGGEPLFVHLNDLIEKPDTWIHLKYLPFLEVFPSAMILLLVEFLRTVFGIG